MKAVYASFDTADAYGNEEEVGKAIRNSGIPREKLFITTKLWNARQREGYEASLKAFEASRKRLGLEYLDLYMIHWPIEGKYIESWKALIKLYREGLIRAIGVCNFKIHHLEDIIGETGIVPAVNQVELHPWLTQKPLIQYCENKGIQVEAYSPLMSGHLGEVAELSALAQKYGRTPAQLVLRWDLQNNIIVIPKSSHQNRIIEHTLGSRACGRNRRSRVGLSCDKADDTAYRQQKPKRLRNIYGRTRHCRFARSARIQRGFEQSVHNPHRLKLFTKENYVKKEVALRKRRGHEQHKERVCCHNA